MTLKWVPVHGVRTVGTVWGNYTTFTTPQLDPHRKVLDSNIGTKKTAKSWVSYQSMSLNAPPIEAIGMRSVDCVAKKGIV